LLIATAGVSFSQSIVANPPSDFLTQVIQRRGKEAKEVEFDLNRDYLKGYISDTESILTSPSRWGKSDWTKALLTVGISVGLYTYDQEIQDWVQKNRNHTSNTVMSFAKPFGDGKYIIPSLCIFYFYGHFFEDGEARRTALLSLESFVVTGVFTQTIKFSTHRHRPCTDNGYNIWDSPSFFTSHLSFPSGHASSAFSIATVIASEYGNPSLVYGVATLTALSRVNDNAHWPSDVFFGSAIGYFTAKAIVGLHTSKRNGSLTILPIADGKYTALLISYKF
jgi:membrane-associated phospholipid phosphatase